MRKSVFLYKELTPAEVGKTGTHEIYIRLPNNFDYEAFFGNIATENGSVLEVNFTAIDTTNSNNDSVNLRFVYFINSNREKRIPSLGELFKFHNVQEEDIVCIESRENSSKKSFYIHFYKKGEITISPSSIFFMRTGDEIVTDPENILTSQALQQIFYGAPGTGKSNTIKNSTEQAEKEGRVFRTTFHPDSDYSTFVGCYKPGMKSSDRIYSTEELAIKLKEIKNSGVTYPCHKFAAQYWRSLKDLSADTIKQILVACGFTESMNVEISKGVAIGQEYLNKDDDGKIIYTFTPQAFTNAYVKAWNTEEDVYLFIEEINRGNCAQIFGDLFQLLDRKNGVSEYPIDADADLANYLSKKLASSTHKDITDEIREGKKLKLPSNLYIWATMNTSDQSLFPIDSAFKRRWDWKYIKITEGKDKDTKKPLGWKILVDDIQDDKVRIYDWWEFLRRMNDVIYGATESADKQMGYFFAKAIDKFKGTKVGEINKDGEYIEKEQVDLQADYITADTFVNKVMFYLWTDVMKDNEYSEIIELMKKDGKQLKFTDFFDESGDEVNHEALRSFLDNVMKDAEKKCDVCNTELVQSLGVGMGTGFKPHSVIFKINEMVDDPYERVKGMWRMSEARADKDITKYVYGYATPEKKIVACYEVTKWKKVTDENGKPRFSFDGTPIKDDPMIGQPVEQIAHARGGVVFYTDNWEKK